MSRRRSDRQRLRRRATHYGIACLCLVVGGWLLLRSDHRKPPDEQARRLAREHGITIGIGDPSSFYTPPYNEAIPLSAAYRLARADRGAVAIALGPTEESLKQYPPGFVSKLIGGIFICGELRMNGAEAGGTVGPRWIILAAPRKLGVEGIQLTSRLGVHHELSSIVYHRDPATAATWEAFAPREWTFTNTSDEALKRFEDPAPALSTGFLSAYGATTAENELQRLCGEDVHGADLRGGGGAEGAVGGEEARLRANDVRRT